MSQYFHFFSEEHKLAHAILSGGRVPTAEEDRKISDTLRLINSLPPLTETATDLSRETVRHPASADVHVLMMCNVLAQLPREQLEKQWPQIQLAVLHIRHWTTAFLDLADADALDDQGSPQYQQVMREYFNLKAFLTTLATQHPLIDKVLTPFIKGGPEYAKGYAQEKKFEAHVGSLMSASTPSFPPSDSPPPGAPAAAFAPAVAAGAVPAPPPTILGPPPPIPGPPPTVAGPASSGFAGGGHGGSSPAAPPEVPFPPGKWSQHRSKRTGQVFFYEAEAGTSVYEDPRKSVVPAPPLLPSEAPLPPGCRGYAYRGKFFYYDSADGTSSWDDPRGVVTAAPPPSPAPAGGGEGGGAAVPPPPPSLAPVASPISNELRVRYREELAQYYPTHSDFYNSTSLVQYKMSLKLKLIPTEKEPEGRIKKRAN